MEGLNALVGFIACTESNRTRRFYVDILGLDFTSEDSFALVLKSGTTVLRVQILDRVTPQPFTVLGWQVADIGIEMDRLQASDVIFERFNGMDQDQRGVWQSPSGARIAWFRDPDGNLLSLTEL